MNRLKFVKSIAILFTASSLYPKSILNILNSPKSNFKTIYSNNILKKIFFNFLKNVFNLFPETQMHKLIDEVSSSKNTDEEIYRELQKKLDDITPFLVDFKYKLSSLTKQKTEMEKQTIELIGSGNTYNGYLEIGSSGRYLDYLEEDVSIEGKIYYVSARDPSYTLTDMIDRGQIAVGAEFLPLNNYQTKFNKIIPNGSLELVTIFIGFHHCPIELRGAFISSIRDTMKKGAKLILRDHNCDTDDQKVLVSLAHDVFNMGTLETWEYNNMELRNFYSLEFICEFLVNLGFEFNKKILFQNGDPTKNALMMFTKI